MKRCSITYVIRKIQMKTTMRYHYTLIRMNKTGNTDNAIYWPGCEATGILIHCWWEFKIIQPLWKTVWPHFTKLNILLPYDLTIALLGIYLSKGVENLCPHKDLQVDVYRNFIHNCQSLEVTKISFSRWMNKWTVVHPDNRILFSVKKWRYQAIKRHRVIVN